MKLKKKSLVIFPHRKEAEPIKAKQGHWAQEEVFRPILIQQLCIQGSQVLLKMVFTSTLRQKDFPNLVL